MAAGLLSQFKSPDLSTFKKDFLQLIRIEYGIDRYYSEANESIDFYLPKYKSFVRLFNKKYPGLKLKLEHKGYEIKLRIFINKIKDVRAVFQEAASKIQGIKSIGAKGFGRADVKDSGKFSAELESAKDKIHISYYDQEAGSNTLVLEHNKKQKLVEIGFDLEAIANERSPEFKLCSYYALKNSFDRKVKIFEKGTDFGFIRLLSDSEKKKELDKFNLRFEE